VDFDYWHRKQTGGRGEYAKVIGYMEPLGHHQVFLKILLSLKLCEESFSLSESTFELTIISEHADGVQRQDNWYKHSQEFHSSDKKELRKVVPQRSTFWTQSDGRKVRPSRWG
jgi:hypothetical protein